VVTLLVPVGRITSKPGRSRGETGRTVCNWHTKYRGQSHPHRPRGRSRSRPYTISMRPGEWSARTEINPSWRSELSLRTYQAGKRICAPADYLSGTKSNSGDLGASVLTGRMPDSRFLTLSGTVDEYRVGTARQLSTKNFVREYWRHSSGTKRRPTPICRGGDMRKTSAKSREAFRRLTVANSRERLLKTLPHCAAAASLPAGEKWTRRVVRPGRRSLAQRAVPSPWGEGLGMKGFQTVC